MFADSLCKFLKFNPRRSASACKLRRCSPARSPSARTVARPSVNASTRRLSASICCLTFQSWFWAVVRCSAFTFNHSLCAAKPRPRSRTTSFKAASVLISAVAVSKRRRLNAPCFRKKRLNGFGIRNTSVFSFACWSSDSSFSRLGSTFFGADNAGGGGNGERDVCDPPFQDITELMRAASARTRFINSVTSISGIVVSIIAQLPIFRFRFSKQPRTAADCSRGGFASQRAVQLYRSIPSKALLQC